MNGLYAKSPIIGIIGGMPPAGTIDMIQKIIIAASGTGLPKPPHLLVDCDSAVPSRVLGANGSGPSPLPYLTAMAERLLNGGAELLVMACNAAHFYYADVKQAVGSIPLLNIPAEVLRSLEKQKITGPVAVIGAAPLVEELYAAYLTDLTVPVVFLPANQRQALNQALEAFAQGVLDEIHQEEFGNILRHFGGTSACTHLVSACTELTMILQKIDYLPFTLIDPVQIAAEQICKYCWEWAENQGS